MPLSVFFYKNEFFSGNQNGGKDPLDDIKNIENKSSTSVMEPAGQKSNIGADKIETMSKTVPEGLS